MIQIEVLSEKRMDEVAEILNTHHIWYSCTGNGGYRIEASDEAFVSALLNHYGVHYLVTNMSGQN